MNSGLLVFAVLLIVAGAFFGIYFIPLIGLFILFIAILAPKSPSQVPRPGPRPPEERPYDAIQSTPMSAPSDTMRYAPTKPQTSLPTTPAGPPEPSGYEQRAASGSPALFPTTMFPSFTQSQTSMGQTTEEKREERKKESRDELVELVAILAILKLTSA